MHNKLYYQESNFKRFMICREEYFNAAMKNLLNNPDEYINDSDIYFFKKGHKDTTTVAVVVIDDRKVVIKRYNQKGFWHSVKRTLRRSRALRSWKNSHYLISNNILTPQPIAMLIKRFGPIRKETYFITEYIDGTQGKDIFLPENLYRYDWRIVILNIVSLLHKLRAANISHDDFQHNNMIFLKDVPCLLDLDHMRIHKYNSLWFRHNFKKDIDNFLKILGKVNSAAQKIAMDIILDER